MRGDSGLHDLSPVRYETGELIELYAQRRGLERRIAGLAGVAGDAVGLHDLLNLCIRNPIF